MKKKANCWSQLWTLCCTLCAEGVIDHCVYTCHMLQKPQCLGNAANQIRAFQAGIPHSKPTFGSSSEFLREFGISQGCGEKNRNGFIELIIDRWRTATLLQLIKLLHIPPCSCEWVALGAKRVRLSANRRQAGCRAKKRRWRSAVHSLRAEKGLIARQ